MAEHGNFEGLQCWQECFKLKEYIRKDILIQLPKIERFELYSQLLRAARSTTANIAEGWGRHHRKDSIRFMIIARGSVAEVLDHTIEARHCNYISSEQLLEIRKQTSTCLRLINGYIKYLSTKLKD